LFWQEIPDEQKSSAVELLVSEADRDQLMSMSRSRSLPAAMVLRAKIVLGCIQQPNSEVARVLNTHPATVGKWRRRFIEGRPGFM
jgi:transposase-like protein